MDTHTDSADSAARPATAPTARTLAVTQNVTLDGVIDATEGWFDVADSEDEAGDVVAVLREHMAVQDALILGRTTFEQMRGFWPRQDDDTTGITTHLNAVQKYVPSTTLDDPGWENTTVWPGDLASEVRALKARPGREIGVTGSISVVHALMAAGLVDEYRLFVYPVALGRGRRLFADGLAEPALRLVEARPFRSGIVLLTYRAGGA
jgi:dihydrofolate reductase